jgi:hypothetical protein
MNAMIAVMESVLAEAQRWCQPGQVMKENAALNFSQNERGDRNAGSHLIFVFLYRSNRNFLRLQR